MQEGEARCAFPFTYRVPRYIVHIHILYIWYILRNIAHVPLMSIRAWLGKVLCLDQLMTRKRDPHHRLYI